MLADDFFNALFNGGYVKKFEWKNIALQTTHYPVGFICEKCNPPSFHIFDIMVENGIHTIRDSSVVTFCDKHGIPLSQKQRAQ